MALTIQKPILATPDHTLIDLASTIPSPLPKDSIFNYLPPFILDNMDAIFTIILTILVSLLILSFVLENVQLRQENAAPAQALANEEKGTMSTATGYFPEKELSGWHTTADEISGDGAGYFRYIPSRYVRQ